VIVRPAHPTSYPWIGARADLVIGPAFRAIEAVDETGRIHGMVGFDGWTQNAVCLHVALDNPAALRALVRVGFGIAFRDRGVVLAQVVGTNERSLNLVKRLGFAPLCVVKDGWAEGLDMTWWQMRRADCRWLKEA
jgi:hypothetical protein